MLLYQSVLPTESNKAPHLSIIAQTIFVCNYSIVAGIYTRLTLALEAIKSLKSYVDVNSSQTRKN
jgi:hypothetical protein